MGKIHILDTDVSNKIAAGEVVERPLSIVKELVENSIDAGATSVTVEIREGGTEFIRVSDNGSGMSAEDAKICFLRHATSKIRTGEDLDSIYTLGFRGEALSSIGAVSKVRLYTKRREDNSGICVSCEGGEILSSAESGMSDGTVVEVCDLFYNTPARRKFLKKASVEAGYITDILSRFIFIHPEISFKLVRDNKDVLFSSGDNNLTNAIYAVYGKDYARNMIDVDFWLNDIHVVGAVGKSSLSRANRTYESFFVNKRYIKSPIIIRALEEAYKNQVMIGKFPTAILNIEVPYDSVDINVHPTKLECKFSREQEIYQAVFHGVRNALYELPNVPRIERKEDDNPASVTGADVQREYNKFVDGEKSIEDLFKKYHNEVKNTQKQAEKPEVDQLAMIDYAYEQMKKKDNKKDFTLLSDKDNVSINESEKPEDWREYIERKREEEKESEPEQEIKNLFDSTYFRVIGQLFETYILVEKDDNLLMIDQHAAHERLNFESLKAEMEENGIMSQIILEPVEIDVSDTEREVYLENQSDFSKLGFESTIDGNVVSLTAIPADVSWSDSQPLFLELLEQMQDMKENIISAKKERMIYTIACKASIKANMKITEEEMRRLAEKVFNLKNINTCPHGRPIVISMSKKEIEKEFKRIV